VAYPTGGSEEKTFRPFGGFDWNVEDVGGGKNVVMMTPSVMGAFGVVV